MKILRSQYLQLQCSENTQQISEGRINKIMPSKGNEHVKGKDVETTTIAPSKLLDKTDTNSSTPATNIKICIENVESLKKLNVVLEYVNMSASWLTNVYKTYENDLWRKKPTLNVHGNKKWVFLCGLCSGGYKSFYSMKTHLNVHLKLYPYVCKICLKQYTGRKSAVVHLRKAHHVEKPQYNDFLIS